MKRKELTDRILEVVSASVQTDWKGGVSDTEAAFLSFSGRNANKRDKSKFVRPPLHEDEKWKRMKGHIAGSASARGISGDRRNAYIYGAMRARGWKPKRERVDETMGGVMGTSKRTLKKVKKQFNREVKRPVRGLMRASRYKTKAGREIAAGNVSRGLEMTARANKVIKAHRPVVAASVAGLAAGFAGLPMPGGAELGAVATAKATKTVTRAVMRRQARLA